jgi:hypothetical protein
VRPPLCALLAALGLVWPTTPAPGQDEPLGRSAAFGPLAPTASATIAAGTPLRSRPDPTAALLITIEEDVELQVMERRGDWIRTAYGDWIGWLAPQGEDLAAAAPAPDLAPPEMRAGRLVLDTTLEEDAARVASARRLLGSENLEAGALGPWPLYTDVRDGKLLALLDRLATRLPESYGRRYGLPPPRDPDQRPILLFASEQAYRTFTSEFTDLGELHGGGHADGSMAALFVGGSTAAEVGSTLIHELTHLLNRTSFEKAPATWLEEGMANDLGFARFTDEGVIESGTLGGDSIVTNQSTPGRRGVVTSLQTGGRAAWTRLARDWRERRVQINPLGRVLDLSWSEFVESGRRSSNYALSTFFVRYLLDGEDSGRAAAFRRFIADATTGSPSGAASLAQALATSIEALERDYELWLTAQMLAAR